MKARTTIMMHEKLLKRVAEHVENGGETMTDFYNRAIINQLESEGDWSIRGEVEEDESR